MRGNSTFCEKQSDGELVREEGGADRETWRSENLKKMKGVRVGT
jgi:hypothetical protein